ncbi:unnamed protein product [Clonostachys rosea]|uniref:DUF1479 domain protein n=1 Tax=Bionectria ochroleuca TaxID=29856 RepID=A0ABY6TRJ7_BIOOC|nr:unnamed protein product [Clonostachys rosea]
MLRTARISALRAPKPLYASSLLCQRRAATTDANVEKKEGDISSVFRSLSGGDSSETLPQRFAEVKRNLIHDPVALQNSWNRLLAHLKVETEEIAKEGSNCIPEIDFSDIERPSKDFSDALRKRGVAVIRQVVPEQEARAYKEEIEKYVAANPSTKAFPPDDPQVFELYWSKPQLAARSHPNMIEAQKFLLSYYHSKDPNAPCSLQQPLTYADRLRIRQPGDAGFSLGPHIDGGGVERWEKEGYGQGQVYDKIFEGKWEEFDAWELSTRLKAKQDLYNGAGACSMFRMFQAWLAMSHTGPKEGTLLVNPLLSLSTSYFLLRPFFAPKKAWTSEPGSPYTPEYLDSDNWALAPPASPELQGAWPGHCQELNHVLHPHLNLPKTMVHVPQIRPGDYVAWHCDTIHAVDKVHGGKSDSSVLYIPACPTTKINLDYVRKQREHFIQGIPPFDFPGGVGESQHVGRPDAAALKELSNEAALRAFGFAPLDVAVAKEQEEASLLEYGNKVLGF